MDGKEDRYVETRCDRKKQFTNLPAVGENETLKLGLLSRYANCVESIELDHPVEQNGKQLQQP